MNKQDIIKMTKEEIKVKLEEIRKSEENGNINCSGCSDCYDCSGCSGCSRCSDCFECSRCSDCFDCIYCFNLKSKQYHILNIEFTKEEYFKIKKEKGLKMHKRIICIAGDGQKFEGPSAEEDCKKYEEKHKLVILSEQLGSIVESWFASYNFDIDEFINDFINGRDLNEVYNLMKEVIELNKVHIDDSK